uniref:GPI-anchored protein At1g27950 family n=1 Tax=Cajanus cajan TaxID=3821 RepID=A0A151SQI0_CAJCA|nr:putative GPI-anchored protein At1g27950 family [Cajanus cajan]
MVWKSKSLSSMLLLLLLVLVGFANSDLSKDREECADKLIGLASCVPYVGGEAKTPTIDCCSGLKVVLDESKKCICILIKDRNDPNLGIKINATLAVHLPSACHAPANISQCVDLLHLAPNSPDAKLFEGFEKSAKTNTSSTPVSSGNYYYLTFDIIYYSYSCARVLIVIHPMLRWCYCYC